MALRSILLTLIGVAVLNPSKPNANLSDPKLEWPLGTSGFSQSVPLETVLVDSAGSSFRTADANSNLRDWKVGTEVNLQANQRGDVQLTCIDQVTDPDI